MHLLGGVKTAHSLLHGLYPAGLGVLYLGSQT